MREKPKIQTVEYSILVLFFFQNELERDIESKNDNLIKQF